jgi:hypothetical protein
MTVRRRFDATVDEWATDWGLPRSVILVILAVPFVLPAITIVAALVSRPTFDVLVGEDMPGEWMQEIAWVLAFVLGVVVTARLAKSGDRTLTALYVVFVIGLFFIVGEEISWGQRLFGIETPEFLEESNRQRELNLHNIFGVQTVFSWGMFVVGLYGTVVPLVLWRRFGAWSRWPDLAKAVVPHPLLVPAFLLMLVWRFYRNLFEPPASIYYGVSEFGEITELVLALAFLAFVTHQFFRTKRSP